MPKVGEGKKAVEYPYSTKGVKDAIAHAKRTGEALSMENSNGSVKKYGHGGMVNPMMPMRPMYKNGGSVPFNNYGVDSLTQNPNRKMDERVKRIVSNRVMGGRPGMARPIRGNGMNPLMVQALKNKIATMKKGGKVKKK